MRVEFRSRLTGKKISVTWDSHREMVLGSKGDLSLDGDGVSNRHARIFGKVADLHIEPIGDAPLAVNGNPVRGSAPVSDGDWLALGSALLQVRITSDQRIDPDLPQNKPSQPSLEPEQHKLITIGRSPGCELEIQSPLISRHHAKLVHNNGVTMLEDLGSTNGTFVNGRRIFGLVRLEHGDRVEFAAFSFKFTGEALEPIGSKGSIRIETRELSKQVRDRATGQSRYLLENINLVIEPGEFVAIFGTSGSGKSTLLDALNGRRPATSGQVLYNGADFYAAFDMFRASIGYVPQQDIVHRKILVQNALRYTARLRLPPDTSDEEIDFHVSRVLKQVGLGDKALLPIDTPSPLSGGQFKRISLAVELIANPNILFLDEVTSGLDAGTDKKMMQLFAELAAEQKTVVCITHTLENIDTCNLVLLLHQGKMIYFGPPKSANAYFNVSKLSEVYDFIDTHPIDYWTKKFEESSYFSDYIENRSSALEADYQPQRDKPGNCIESRQAQFHFRQLITLLRRNINLLLADRRNLAIMFLQAPLVGILVGLVFDISSSAQARAATESNIGFILVLSSIWCGCLNSTREVIKELPIYLRERAVNLGIGSYLASKLIPLTVICLVQCFTLLSTVTLLTSWSGDFIGRLCTLFLAAMAATCMGLAVSTLVDSNDKAVAFIPILLIPQVILSNSIVRLEKMGAGIAQATVIAFSSFDAMKATLSSEATSLAPAEMAFQADLITTVCLAMGFLLAALLGLKLKDMKSK